MRHLNRYDKINLVNYYNRNEKHEKVRNKIGKVISDVLPLF